MGVKLKPCPFCGGRARLKLIEVDEPFTFTDLYYTVICTKCGLRKGRYSIPKLPEFCEAEDTAAKMTAVAEWNRREGEQPEHSGGVYTDGYIEQSPSVQTEPTFEQIKEYCERRCLTIITNDLYHDLITAYSAQSERLTDDDFETIRIHLNAYKEGLWNQGRLEEAEDYQRIIDRFMSFASAQPKEVFEFDKTYPLAGLQVEITKGAYGGDFITIKRPERFLGLDGTVYTQDADRQGWTGEDDETV